MKKGINILVHLIIWLLTISCVIIIFVDIFNINLFNLHDWSRAVYPGLLWVLLFKEGGIVETIQWTLLSLSLTILLSRIFLLLSRNQLKHFYWFLLVIGLLLMLLEDSINLRHSLSAFLGESLVNADVTSHEWRTSNFRSFIEICFYGLLGSIMLLFIYCLNRSFKLNENQKRYFLLAYLLYGLAAVGSATRNIGDWYSVVGTKILNFLVTFGNTEWTGESVIYYRDPLGFWFMDLVVEESLELFGAVFMLCAVISAKDLIFDEKN